MNSEPRYRKERHVRFTCYSLCQQCLSGARRPDEQNALRDSASEFCVPLWVLQKINNLDQFSLGLIDSSDIGERDVTMSVLVIDLGAALTDAGKTGLPHF